MTDQIDRTVDDSTESQAPRSRRDLLTKGTVAAAVAAVAGTSLSSRTLAANGSTFLIGSAVNDASATTLLSGGSTLKVEDGTSNGSASIYGLATGSGGSYGVRGEHSGTGGGTGVYGVVSGTQSIGVYGLAQATGSGTPGVGVKGKSVEGAGVVGEGATYDFSTNGTGRIFLKTATSAPSSTASGSPGTIARDSTGALWCCVATNQWRRVAGPSTAGSFVPVTPFRVYDSRNSGSGGALFASANRTISVANAINTTTGAVSVPNAVPAGTTAVSYNVTIVGTTLSGFLSVNPGGTASLAASTINWGAGNTGAIANSSVVAVSSSRELKIFAGGQAGSSTQFIIDIVGYYL